MRPTREHIVRTNGPDIREIKKQSAKDSKVLGAYSKKYSRERKNTKFLREAKQLEPQTNNAFQPTTYPSKITKYGQTIPSMYRFERFLPWLLKKMYQKKQNKVDLKECH